jgi:hypothetical protein
MRRRLFQSWLQRVFHGKKLNAIEPLWLPGLRLQ